MRLIDADELEEWVWRERLDTRERIANLVKRMPTIDPVKKGEWLNTSTDIPNLSMNVCSECGFQYPSAIRPRFNYCPNCGARMEA